MKGYFPRVTIRGDSDLATDGLRIALLARPIDEKIVENLERAWRQGAAGIDLLVQPEDPVFGAANPLSMSHYRRVRVETTKVTISIVVQPDELKTMTERKLVEEVLGGMLKDFAEHEIEEFFRFDGRRVFNPHPEVPGYQDK